MTATGQRKWRVTVRNFSKMEMGVEQELTGPVTIIDEFNSFDAALEPSIDFDLLPEFFQQNRPNSDISDYAPA